MTINYNEPSTQRKRRGSASSASSGWSFDQVDWDTHAAASAAADTPESVPTPTRSPPPYEPTGPLPSASDPPPTSIPADPSSPPSTTSPLLALPPDILLHHVVPQLPYPALLALRLAHPHFYHSPLLYPARAPAIRLKVRWLDERRDAGLGGPDASRRLRIDSDAGFLSNREVARMLRRESCHADCRPGPAGCRVTGLAGAECGGPAARRRSGLTWMDVLRQKHQARKMAGWHRLARWHHMGHAGGWRHTGGWRRRSPLKRLVKRGLAVVALTAVFSAALWSLSLTLATVGWAMRTLSAAPLVGGNVVGVSCAAALFCVTMAAWRR